MRTKGARNRTPEERVQLKHAARLASVARRKLPSERQKQVLDVIAAAGASGVSLEDVVRLVQEAGHPPVTKGHAKSLIQQLSRKGLIHPVHRPVAYIAIPR